MGESILEPKLLSPHAPRIVSVKIPADRIGELIGPGGKNIKGIQAESGAFMEVLPGKDGLVHVSELAEGRTEKVEDIVKKVDVITAKCLGVDEKGRVKMSRRAWLRDQAAAEPDAQQAVAAE